MMIVLALLMLTAAVLAVVIAVSDGGGTVEIDQFGLDTELPVWGVFVAGIATGLVALAGIVALAAAMRRARARRTEIRHLREKVATQDVADDGTATPQATGDQPVADTTTEPAGRHGVTGRWRRRHAADDETSTRSEPPTGAARS
ncbi:hypothetical protein [Jiangella asiatica]|uniref:LapA family protein n=1 Tax=Jiangella asiatica TaxID=2530372 RepID=A0A4R5DBL8_9ACTN|nr:hypothetical protein [Jiangella asiatica]TDE08944.1 hypothetical protein E1269_16120 [Jiangella asiatica]